MNIIYYLEENLIGLELNKNTNNSHFIINNKQFLITYIDLNLKYYLLVDSEKKYKYILYNLFKDIWTFINISVFNIFGIPKSEGQTILLSNKFMYLPIEKCGCSLVSLLKCFNPKTKIEKIQYFHLNKDFNRLFTKNRYQYDELSDNQINFINSNLFKFTVIRDPYDRILSIISMYYRYFTLELQKLPEFDLLSSQRKNYFKMTICILKYLNYEIGYSDIINMIIRQKKICKLENIEEDGHIQQYVIKVKKLLSKGIHFDKYVDLSTLQQFVRIKLKMNYNFFSVTGKNSNFKKSSLTDNQIKELDDLFYDDIQFYKGLK